MSTLSVCPLFSDHAVLLRSADTVIWGKASPEASVTLTLGTHSTSTHANAGGRWQMTLDTREFPDTPLTLHIESNGEQLIYRDILIGEVWLCSGQSNMEMRLVKTAEAEVEIQRPTETRFRHFKVLTTLASSPSNEFSGQWVICSPSTVGNFTALAYYFGKRLLSQLDTPIGLVNSSWGTTTIESWSSADALDSISELHDKRINDLAKLRHYEEQKGLLNDEQQAAEAYLHKQLSTALFNAMISPLIPYSIRGILWYQGESNVGRATLYEKLFPLFIKDWRQHWKKQDLPFYFCQLSAYNHPSHEAGASDWAELREAQQSALQLPATGMIPLIDCGEAEDIHPRDKRTPGERLAALALTEVYERPQTCYAPTVHSCQSEGTGLRITFNHTGNLVAKPLPATYPVKTAENSVAPLPSPLPESQVQGFAIRGNDDHWHWAYAYIEGNSVVVNHPDITAPQAVSYAWADYPFGNLTDATNLPVIPFRLYASTVANAKWIPATEAATLA